jgi:hypothetical protein
MIIFFKIIAAAFMDLTVLVLFIHSCLLSHNKYLTLLTVQLFNWRCPYVYCRIVLAVQIEACLAEKPADMDAFLQAIAIAGYEARLGRGCAISFRAEGQKRFTRLHSSTLGEGISNFVTIFIDIILAILFVNIYGYSGFYLATLASAPVGFMLSIAMAKMAEGRMKSHPIII